LKDELKTRTSKREKSNQEGAKAVTATPDPTVERVEGVPGVPDL
jgi:hypothetical protein